MVDLNSDSAASRFALEHCTNLLSLIGRLVLNSKCQSWNARALRDQARKVKEVLILIRKCRTPIRLQSGSRIPAQWVNRQLA